jgi:hypothetical protein
LHDVSSFVIPARGRDPGEKAAAWILDQAVQNDEIETRALHDVSSFVIPARGRDPGEKAAAWILD